MYHSYIPSDKEKVKVSYFDSDINDMVETTIYWRDNALKFANWKKWVTIRVVS